MGILNEFERRLEGVIEGIFTRAFRSGLHPVELARRILKEMEAGRTVGVRGVWVPNRFVFHLSSEDRERFGAAEKALRRELEQVVFDGAGERGWGLVGPPEVTFETDPGLRRGDLGCEASLVEGPTGWLEARAAEAKRAGAGEEGPPPASRAPEAVPPTHGELVFVDGASPGRVVALDRARTIVGRLPECDLVVDDPGASRRHAEVRREHGQWVVADLGSTNGTLVNERPVGEQPLRDGDRITIGSTVLEFRRR